MQLFHSGIPGCKTQFCWLNIAIRNVSKEQSLATTKHIKPTFKSHLKIFGRKLIKNPMRLLELRNSHHLFKETGWGIHS